MCRNRNESKRDAREVKERMRHRDKELAVQRKTDHFSDHSGQAVVHTDRSGRGIPSRGKTQGSSRAKYSRRFGKIQNPLTAIARWLCFRLHLEDNSSPRAGSAGELRQELRELGTGKKNCVYDYYVRKISLFLLLILLTATGLGTILILQHRQDRSVENGILDRPGYGKEGASKSLLLRVEQEEETEEIDVILDARCYTPSQVRRLLQDAQEEFAEAFPGENDSLDEIRSPLNLPPTLQNGAVSAEYLISPPGVIGEDGSICTEPDPEGTLISINAAFTCQGQTSSFECAALVFPPLLSQKEQLRKNIRTAIESAQTEDPSSTHVKLPDTVDGKKLYWSYPENTSFRVIILLLLILPAAFWVHEDSRVHEAAKERLNQLELDYSQLLWKLTMLLSAGLTIRGAFTRIAAQYTSQERPKRYVYEEILLSLREMQSGVPEASAYENFGRRCSLPSYIKLGSLLSQNLKKGSKGLTSLLEHEAVLSMEQHKMAVRKLGERASVKMLLPMILMLGVVITILMVPAFLSM